MFLIKQINRLQRMTGAVAGTFYPNLLIKKVFGQELESGPTFAYLFRRFGYPIHGWDDYKELCSYTLTTPMRGVCLEVSIKSGVDFRYMVTEKLDRVCQVEKYAPYDTWHNNFRAWAKAQGYQPLYQWSDKTTEAELEAVAGPWLAAKELTEEQVTDEIQAEFWTEQEDKLNVWREKYQAIEPWPELAEEGEIYGETRLKVWAALERAAKELLRPVRIRDGCIDVLGRVDEPGKLNPLKESPMAGLGIGWLYDIYLDEGKRDRYFDYVDQVRKRGNGDFLTGLESLLDCQVERTKRYEQV